MYQLLNNVVSKFTYAKHLLINARSYWKMQLSSTANDLFSHAANLLYTRFTSLMTEIFHLSILAENNGSGP